MSALSGEELLGVVGYHSISWIDGSAEIFTSVMPKWRGKGLALNLVQNQLDYAFKDLGFRRITMTTLAGAPSAKIADKMKVPIEGRFVRSRLKRGVYHDAIAYALERPQ
jgi:RimJ/RimL family protein N-acetyltransferase